MQQRRTEQPRKGTLAYEYYHLGLNDEAAARTEGKSQAGLEVMGLVDALAEDENLDQAAIADMLLMIYCTHVSLRRRLGMAWRLLFG